MQPQAQSESFPAASAAHPLRGLLTIFFSPDETFETAGHRPWLVPIVAAALLTLLIQVMVINVMGMGTITRNQLESNPKIVESLGPEKVNQMVQEAESSGTRKLIAYAAGLLVTPLILAFIAGLTLAGLLATGAQTNFSASFAATAWSTYCALVVTAICTGIFLSAVTDFSGVDPQNMVMLNASVLLDKQTTKGWVRALASGIDIVALGALWIKCIGLTKLSQRVSMGQAAGVSIALYGLYIAGKAGFAAMFG